MTSGIGKRRTAARKASKTLYRQRRKEIARAATRVFHEKGFQATSMGAVAKELNIDRASLYYYISSKEELFDEVVREVVQNNVATAQEIQRGDDSAPDKFRKLVMALMDAYEKDYPLLNVYIRENLRHVGSRRSHWSKIMRKLNRDYEEAVIAIIEEGYEDGSFRKVGDARVVAYGVIGIVSWTNRWYRPGRSEVSGEEIGHTYAEMLLTGLQT